MCEIALKVLRLSQIKCGYSLTNSLKVTDFFYWILLILCEYIMGIVLFNLYNSLFSSTIQMVAGNWIYTSDYFLKLTLGSDCLELRL